MKHVVRFIDETGQPKLAMLSQEGQAVELLEPIEQLVGRDPEEFALGDKLGSLEGRQRLAPVQPSKIVCVGLNYRKHAEEMNKAIPEEPLLFMKPPTALNHHEGVIDLPPASALVHHEGELAVVIGARLCDASAQQAAEAILGYCCANDVTARDIQRREKRYTRGKGYDSFCPLGPCLRLARGFDHRAERLELRVNGELRQASQLDDFIHPVDEVLSFISQIMTLLPGDVVLTGTPHGVGPLVAGDTVEVSISGVGRLRNSCAARAPIGAS